jgi:hypothetical protein
MKRIYDTGMDNNSINLEVKLGSVGVAYTATYLFRSGGIWTKISESNEDSGNIQNAAIGTTEFLRKSYIVVRTLIDFSHLDENQREMATKNIYMKYTFSGGFSGIQEFNYDNDDLTITPNKKLVTIVKPIEMK